MHEANRQVSFSASTVCRVRCVVDFVRGLALRAADREFDVDRQDRALVEGLSLSTGVGPGGTCQKSFRGGSLIDAQ